MRSRLKGNQINSSTKVGLVTNRPTKKLELDLSLSQLLNKSDESSFQLLRAHIMKKLDHMVSIADSRNSQGLQHSINQTICSLYQKRDQIPTKSFINIVKKLDRIFKVNSVSEDLRQKWLQFLFSILVQKCELQILDNLRQRKDHLQLLIVLSSFLMETLNQMIKLGRGYSLNCDRVFQYSYMILEIAQSNISINYVTEQQRKIILFFLRTFFAYSYLNVPQISQKLSFFQSILKLYLLYINNKVLSTEGLQLMTMMEEIEFDEEPAQNIYRLCWNSKFSLNTYEFQFLTMMLCKYHQSYSQSQYELDKCVQIWISAFWQNCKRISVTSDEENRDRIIETLEIYTSPEILKSIWRVLFKENLQYFGSKQTYFQEVLQSVLQETMKISLLTSFTLSIKILQFISMIVFKMSLYRQWTGKLGQCFGEEKSWLLSIIQDEIFNRVYFGNTLMKQKQSTVRKLFFIKLFAQVIGEIKHFCKSEKLLNIIQVSLSWLIGQTLIVSNEQLIPQIKFTVIILCVQYFANAATSEETILGLRFHQYEKFAKDDVLIQIKEERTQRLAKKLVNLQSRKVKNLCQTHISSQLFLTIYRNIHKGFSYKWSSFTSCFVLIFISCSFQKEIEIDNIDGKMEETTVHLIKILKIIQNASYYKKYIIMEAQRMIRTPLSWALNAGSYVQLILRYFVDKLNEEVGKSWIQEESKASQEGQFQLAQILIQLLQALISKKCSAPTEPTKGKQDRGEQKTQEFLQLKEGLKQISSQINQSIIVIFSHYILNRMVLWRKLSWQMGNSIGQKKKLWLNHAFLMGSVYLKLKQLTSIQQNLSRQIHKQREGGKENQNIIVGNLYQLVSTPIIQKLAKFLLSIQALSQNYFPFSSIASTYLSSQSLKTVSKFSLLSNIPQIRELYQTIEGTISYQHSSNQPNSIVQSNASHHFQLITLKGRLRVIRKIKIKELIDQ